MKNPNFPESLLAGLTVLSEKSDQKLSELSVLEFEKIFRFLIFELSQELQQPSELSKPLFYNRKEACAILRISLPQLEKLMKQGIVKFHRLGEKRIIFTEQDFWDTVENLKSE